jgi:hypothetical protein
MRGSWYDGGAVGASSKDAVTVTKRQTLVARAIAPLNASLEGERLTYAVRFAAKARDGQASLAENLRVRLWLADDQNQHATPLRAVHLSLDSAGRDLSPWKRRE